MKIIFIIILFVVSCRYTTENTIDDCQNYIVDSVVSDILYKDIYNIDLKYYKIKNEYFFITLSFEDSCSLLVYDKNLKFLWKKRIYNILCKNIIDFYIVNWDTIYWLTQGNVLYLTDTNFKIKKQWFFNHLISQEFGNQFELYSSIRENFYVKNNLLFVFHFPNYVLDTQKKIYDYFSKKLELVISLDSSKIIAYRGAFPDIYLKKTFYDFNPNRISTPKFDIFNYKVTNEIYIYKDTIFLFKKNIKSNFYAKPYEFDNSKYKDFNYINKYSLENFEYINIMFNPFYNNYYRICLHSISYKDENGMLRTTNDKRWSVIIFDTNFNVKKEIIFTQQYNFRKIFTTNQGLLVLKNKPKKMKNEKTVFVVFSF